MNQKIQNKYLIDQFLDNPEIRQQLADKVTPQEILSVFEQRGIRFEQDSAEDLADYVRNVLSQPYVKDNPGKKLHI